MFCGENLGDKALRESILDYATMIKSKDYHIYDLNELVLSLYEASCELLKRSIMDYEGNKKSLARTLAYSNYLGYSNHIFWDETKMTAFLIDQIKRCNGGDCVRHCYVVRELATLLMMKHCLGLYNVE